MKKSRNNFVSGGKAPRNDRKGGMKQRFFDGIKNIKQIRKGNSRGR